MHLSTKQERAALLAQIEGMLGIKAFKHTIAALLSAAAIVCIVGGRRSGKTFASQVAAIRCVFTHRNAQVLVTGPNTDSIRRWISECAGLLEGSDLARGSTVNIEAGRIDFSNGSAIIGVPPTAGRLRGYGRDVWMVVIDEAGFCPSSLWRDVRYVLADHADEGAQCWMIGSPWENGFFRQTLQAGLDGDPDIHSEPPWRTEQNPRLSRTFIAQERARTNTIEAMVEFDGEFPDVSMKMFSPARMNRAVTPGLELPALRELVGPARGIAAWDFGVSFDTSVCVVVYRVPVRGLNPDWDGRPVFLMWPYVYEAGTPLVDVVDDGVNCPAPFLHRSLEPNGVGAMPTQEAYRRIKAHPVRRGENRVWWMHATTAQLKVSAYSLMLWALERDQFIWPSHPQMLRQFSGVELEQTGRVPSIGASDPNTHDDIPDACARAMLAYTPEGSGRTVCGFQDLAGERAVPDAPLQELDVDVIETGSGLKVYQRPILQSVADTRVTLPAGAGPAKYRDTTYDGVREQVQAALHPSEKE